MSGRLRRTLTLPALALQVRARRLWSEPSIRLLLLGVGAGALGGVSAGVFDAVRATLGALISAWPDASAATPSPWVAVIVPTVGGLLAGGLLQVVGRPQRPMGMARLVEAVQLRHGEVDGRAGLGTAAAAAIALAAGHSGGREAPVASLAAALTHGLAHRLGLSAGQVRVLVAAAAAGAISASFNTPLGSAVLAMELLLGSFALQHFGPVVAATVTGTLVGQALLGERVAFDVAGFDLVHPLELLAYAGLGVVCGLVARSTVSLTLGTDRLVDRLEAPAWARGALAGLGVGALAAVGLPQVMGTGYPFLDALLADTSALPIQMLALLLAAKLLATALTFAGRTGPGLLSPLLVLGGLTGVLYGGALQVLLPAQALVPGAYGLVAMGAVAAAALRAPLAMTLVLFELTGTYSVVPVMALTVGVAALVAHALRPASLYEDLLVRTGVHLHPELPPHLRAQRVAGLATTDGLVTVTADAGLDDYVAAFRRTRSELVWRVDAVGRYLGAVHVQDVLDALAGADAQLERDVPVLHPDTSVAEALEILGPLDVYELPVVAPDGRLVGVLTERALLEAVRHP